MGVIVCVGGGAGTGGTDGELGEGQQVCCVTAAALALRVAEPSGMQCMRLAQLTPARCGGRVLLVLQASPNAAAGCAGAHHGRHAGEPGAEAREP